MARKRYSDEDILNLLRQIELDLNDGNDIGSAHRNNGCNERFNGTLRGEVLNAEWFSITRQAEAVIGRWLRRYNHVRHHQGLNMKAPVSETLRTISP